MRVEQRERELQQRGVSQGEFKFHEFGVPETSTAPGADLSAHSYVGGLGQRSEGGGIYYARQRWYDSSLGRWLSADPIGFAGGLNLYTYVGQNPAGFVDPNGLIPGRDYGEMYLPKTEGALQRREAGTRAMAPKVLKEVALLAILGGGIRIVIRGCALLRYGAALNLAGDAAELGEEVSALREGMVPAVEMGRLAVVVHCSQLTAEVADGLIAYVRMMQAAHKLRYLMMVSAERLTQPFQRKSLQRLDYPYSRRLET